MPSYRGISQKDILDSLQRAEAFVRGLHLGPVSERVLDHWLAGAPYSKIAAAKDDAALAAAIAESRAGVFSWFGDVFECHARQGEPGNGLYRALADWDGLGFELKIDDWLVDAPPRTPEAWEDSKYMKGLMERTYQLFAERNTHIILELASRLGPGETAPGSPFSKAFAEAATESTQHTWVAKAQDFVDFLPQLMEARAKEGQEAARDLVLSHPDWDMFLKNALELALGANKDTSALDAISRFGKYGLMEEDFYLFTELSGKVKPDEEKAKTVLGPFMERGEVVETGVGCITIEPEYDLKRAAYGFWMRSTRAAAEALADAFPGRQVIDHARRQIQPRATANPAARPPVP